MIRQPSPQTLRKLLRYDADTGLLYWNPRTPEMFRSNGLGAEKACDLFNAQYANREAFTAISKNGYRVGAIFRRNHLAHRVIWAMVNGEWPADQIDHINGNKSDNRIGNLRGVCGGENHLNMKRPKNNSSGVIGVHWSDGNKGWVAQIEYRGRKHCLGTFPDKAHAVAARKAAENRFGFHHNHGRAE